MLLCLFCGYVFQRISIMCLAIYKPENISIPYDYLENGFNENPHGAGFAYYNGTLNVKKGYFKFDDFMSDYLKCEKYKSIIHFRWATSGKKDIDNCHPFTFSNYAVIHNGVLNHRSTETESDTNCFTKDILSSVIKRYGLTKKVKKILSKHIGESNKMVILSKYGDVHFLNKHCGHWLNNVWYSNTSYKDSYFFSVKKQPYDYANMEYCDYCYKSFNINTMVLDRDFTVCDDCYQQFARIM